MANTLELGNGKWATGKDTVLAFNDQNNNFKPLPFSFSRDTSGTVVNKDGLIETVGVGEPRIDFKDNTKGALLLEPSRTNIVPYSEDFNNSAWNKIAANITPNNTISPDGTQNSYLFVPNSSGGQLYDGLGSKAASAISYTTSLYVKPKGLNSLRIYLHGSSNANRGDATFNLSNQTVSFSNNGAFTDTSASILNVGNGWYRCILVTKSDTSTSLQLVIRYDGSVDNISGLNLWGCQTEQGSYATSYIPTSGSAVTRVGDNITQTTPNLSNSQEVTAFIDLGARPLTGSNSTSDAIEFYFASNNRIIYNQNGSSKHRIEINTDQYSTRNYYSTDTFSTTPIKIAIAVTQSTLKIYTNRGDSWNVPIEGVADWSNLALVKTNIIQSIGNIKINDLKFYNTALTDQELIALTQ